MRLIATMILLSLLSLSQTALPPKLAVQAHAAESAATALDSAIENSAGLDPAERSNLENLVAALKKALSTSSIAVGRFEAGGQAQVPVDLTAADADLSACQQTAGKNWPLLCTHASDELQQAALDCRDGHPSDYSAYCTQQITTFENMVSAKMAYRPASLYELDRLSEEPPAIANSAIRNSETLATGILLGTPLDGVWLSAAVPSESNRGDWDFLNWHMKDAVGEPAWHDSGFDRLTSFQKSELDGVMAALVIGASNLSWAAGERSGFQDGWRRAVRSYQAVVAGFLSARHVPLSPPTAPAPCYPTYTISPSLGGWTTITPSGC